MKRRKGKTYESNLLDDVDSVDILIATFCESAVGHHSVLSTIVLVVHRDDHWVVVLDCLSELECGEIIQIKLDSIFGNLLIKTCLHCQVVDIVLSVWRVEHFWRVVWVLLFSDAHVHADVSIAKSIKLERDHEFMVVCHFL